MAANLPPASVRTGRAEHAHRRARPRAPAHQARWVGRAAAKRANACQIARSVCLSGSALLLYNRRTPGVTTRHRLSVCTTRVRCNGAALEEKERETASLHTEHREHVQKTAEKLNLMMCARNGNTTKAFLRRRVLVSTQGLAWVAGTTWRSSREASRRSGARRTGFARCRRAERVALKMATVVCAHAPNARAHGHPGEQRAPRGDARAGVTARCARGQVRQAGARGEGDGGSV
jgi:hypothetical protein